MTSEKVCLTHNELEDIQLDVLAYAGLNIVKELVRKALNCVKYEKDQKIHSVDGLLSSASTYIKSATVVFDYEVKKGFPHHKYIINEIIKMLDEIINLTYENSRFKGVIDKYAFELKYKKVKHHAKVLQNRLKQLLR